jgi:hypothetical protein
VSIVHGIGNTIHFETVLGQTLELLRNKSLSMQTTLGSINGAMGQRIDMGNIVPVWRSTTHFEGVLVLACEPPYIFVWTNAYDFGICKCFDAT